MFVLVFNYTLRKMCLDIVGVLNAYQVSVLGRKISECISLSLDFTFHIHRSAMWVSVCLPVFFYFNFTGRNLHHNENLCMQHSYKVTRIITLGL